MSDYNYLVCKCALKMRSYCTRVDIFDQPRHRTSEHGGYRRSDCPPRTRSSHVPTRSWCKVQSPCVSKQGHGLRRGLTTRSDYAFVALSGKTRILDPSNIELMLG